MKTKTEGIASIPKGLKQDVSFMLLVYKTFDFKFQMLNNQIIDTRIVFLIVRRLFRLQKTNQ